jgi:hypothetical protein
MKEFEKRLLLLCLAWTLVLTVGHAQLSAGGFPASNRWSGQLRSTKADGSSTTSLPVIKMPAFSLSADTSNHNSRLRCAQRFAHKFKVDIDIRQQGAESTTDSLHIWRLAIQSDSAYSINIILSRFKVPAGARLFVYSPSQQQMLGAFTSRNNTNGKFAIAPIEGDQLIIEYDEPLNPEFAGEVTIESVNHDYMGLRSLRTLPSYKSSESCEINAATDTLHIDQRQSACLLLLNGDTYCSGNLINNSNEDGTPYVISSAHCMFLDNTDGSTYIDTAMAQTIVFFFNYGTPSASWNIEGSREMTLSGAHTAAFRTNRDMLLLRLNDIPPIDYRPYYAGWSHENSVQGPVYDFHHPGGDVLKISTDNDNPSIRSFTVDGIFLTYGHWQIYRWDSGITEGGSSGSALFNANDRIVGGLSGGNTDISCSVPGYDAFWRLDVAWNDASSYHQNLAPWLNPTGQNEVTLNGMQPYSNPCIRYTNRKDNEIPATDNYSNGYPAGHNKYGLTEFAERFAPGYQSTLYGIYFFPEKGNYEQKAPVYLRIYAGKDKPDSLLLQQELKIQTSQYNQTSRQFGEVQTRQWYGRENYYRLSTPLKMDSTFFIAFSLSPVYRADSFALYHSEARTDSAANTAYYRDADNNWQPYTSHPLLKAATSLMVDVVLHTGWNNADTLKPIPIVVPADTTPVTPADTTQYPSDFSFSQNTHSTAICYLLSPKGEVLKNLQIFDAWGRTCLSLSNIDAKGYYTINVNPYCQSGIFIIKAQYKYETRYYKFIKLAKDE